MSEPSIQKQLEAEQAAINALTDTTEAAFAGAALRWKAAALKGEKGAADELAKASAALREYRESVGANGNTPGSVKTETPGEWFKNETEAYNYIISLGHDVSRGKFNQDKNSGLLTCDGKRVSKFSVLQYAMRLKQSRQIVNSANLADMQAQREADEARKAKSEADIKEMQAENMRRRLSADWAHRTEVYTTWAGIMGDLFTAITHNNSYNLGHIITMVKGDQTRLAQLDEFMGEIVAKSFNEVAMQKRIEGTFRSEEVEIEEEEE